MKHKIFISSPYSNGDVEQNVHAQIKAADQLMNFGFVPFVPLLSHYQELVYPRPYQDWLEFTLAWVLSCDALLRLPGKSSGADNEVRHAKENGIPVFYTLDELTEHFTKTISAKN